MSLDKLLARSRDQLQQKTTNFQKGGGIKTLSVDFDPIEDYVTVELGE
jgi:hypothetical protein